MLMLPPIIILCALGVLFGIGLYIASKVFHVKIDPRVAKVEHALPGANCGACGMAGCSALARAIVHGSAEPDMCTPGGFETAKKIAEIIGKEVEQKERKVAIVNCQRRDAKLKYDYVGEPTCRSANLLHKGQYKCQYACLGFGDCYYACPFGAIEMVDGIPVIDEEKCTACGKCVKACPKGIIELRSVKSFVHVLCGSHDKGAAARKSCASACIGCMKCEKTCPFDAIHVEDNLAVIDYEKCTSCGKCVKECPTGAIGNFREKRKKKE